MPTADRARFVAGSIRMFLAQDYPDKELVIVDDGSSRLDDVIPRESGIRYIRLRCKTTLGIKRNIACDEAHGDMILHWDDDDWYARWRIGYQAQQLASGDADICGLERPLFLDADNLLAWEYRYGGALPWLCGATLGYTKAFWNNHRFSDTNVGEDTRFVQSAYKARIKALTDERFFVGRIHSANSSPKVTSDIAWQPLQFKVVRDVIGDDWERYFGRDYAKVRFR